MSEIKVDTVAEKTSANGVTIDGLSIKDSKLVTANSVVETNLTNDIVTLAKMAAGTDGNIISYDASGNPVAIATGNDGQVLTSTGAGSPPAFETAVTGLTGVSTASGNVTITDGNLVLASGHGIDFAATGDIGGTGSELLNDYEEGTWTPTFESGGSAMSNITVSKATYTKIGRQVLISATCRYTGSSSTSQIVGYNLPFTSASTAVLGVSGTFTHDPGSGNTGYIMGSVGANGGNTNYYFVIPGGRYLSNWTQNYYLNFAFWYTT